VNINEVLDRLEKLYDEEKWELAERELARGKKLFPGSLELREWESILLASEERFEEALKVLDSILAQEPGRLTAMRERATLLLELGRFEEALSSLRSLEARNAGADDPVEKASIHFEMASCLDRLGTAAAADAEFRKAERHSGEYPAPSRLGPEEFDALVAQALDSIPDKFQPYLRQVSVVTRDYPTGEDPDPFLLGLYVGVPRTERSIDEKDNPDTIFIYKRNHELLNLPREELREEIRKTVVHEIAHHFGLGEQDMGEYA